jgi:hypothetical protein
MVYGLETRRGSAVRVNNVIYVDFRFSKDIRSRQALSLSERMQESSDRTLALLRASRSALENIKAMSIENGNDQAG